MEELFAKSRELPANAPEPAGQPTDAEVRRVRELIQAMLKTKRAFEMYPSNNPLLAKFKEDIQKRFESYFEDEERLTLSVRQQEILYRGQQTYHNPEKEDNLALFFYKDGLRELTFSRGFAGDEVLDFVDVIRARPEASIESYDDDIVTLLWEKDFVHLSYHVIEEFGEGTTAEEDEVGRILERNRTTDGSLAEAYKDAAVEEGKDQIFSPLEKISMGFHGVFSLGEEEVKYLKEEIEALTDDNFMQGAIHALFESLYLDRGTPDFEVLMNNLDSALNYLIYSGGFKTAARILGRFRDLAREKDTFSPAEVNRINSSIAKAGSEARVKTVAEILNSGREVNPADFQQFLFHLDKGAIIPLSNLMGEIQNVEYRKVLVEALVSLGRDNIDVLAAGMKDRRWYVVRNIAAILGRIGDKTALEYLKQAASHTEPKVRREVVRALGVIGGPKAGDILLQCIEDEDPQIRMTAIRYLPSAQSYAVLDRLMEMITRSDFSERALPEKRVFFEVLAEIGQDRVLPFMVKLLKKRGLFQSAKNDETRVSAAYGLGNIHQKEALETLQDELRRAKKGGVLAEALSYSIHKLAGQTGMTQEA